MTVLICSDPAAAGLAHRQRDGGRLEVQCPVCATFRPAFAVVRLSVAAAALAGEDWACDGCLSRWDRQQSGEWAAHDFASLTEQP